MPRVDSDIKLDFKDAFLRSTLRSRVDVSSSHTLLVLHCVCVVTTCVCVSMYSGDTGEIKNSKKSYKGIPVIAANMDTVGTFEMAVALAKVTIKFICCLFSLFFSFHHVSPVHTHTHTPSMPLFLHCSFAFLSGISVAASAVRLVRLWPEHFLTEL